MSSVENSEPIDGIAIIGMAGRFPGAGTIQEYWQNLCNGCESISSFTAEELIVLGKDAATVTSPDYVARRAILGNCDQFDAEFFGFTSREAEMTDPQQRLFMECAWEALELAGYGADKFRGAVGVYAGTGMAEYLFHLYSNRELIRKSDAFHLLFGNEKDFLATRTSYKLNLRGPSVNVNTACSTSLVAVAVACQSLLNGECDIALAGGVTINFPEKGGYIYAEGSIMAPDGHCRAFDADAQGTVGGNGVGVVVLKRLDDAMRDGDPITAVVRGFATNNDGAMKVGFTAPSVEGQAAVIREALANAGVGAESIGYVEAHGTGTNLGDPIEIAALTKAYRLTTSKKQFCGIGSVKTNIGHLDAAAGVAGLIKAALAVKEGVVPASLHYQKANGEIDFANSPFYVNDRLRKWETSEGPRRAGVSSFGIGGTNAHVILEEAPKVWESSASREKQLLVVSGRNEKALQEAAGNLSQYLQSGQVSSLGDVAYTLAVGRKGFQQRMAVVCGSAEEAIEKLREGNGGGVVKGAWKGQAQRVAMLLSGQGSQYVQMGRQLYEQERVFREVVDRSSEYLQPLLGLDLRQVMFAQGEEEEKRAAGLLRQTWLTQPALYVLECALLQQWESWGIKASAMLGHSLGEIVAARAAGVFGEEEGLRLVAERGRLMWETEAGAMLSAVMSEAEAAQYIGEGIWLAAVNGKLQVVFSGGEKEIVELEKKLAEKETIVKRLAVERAFHSGKMEKVKREYLEVVKKLKLQEPGRRYVSNVTGTWAGPEVTEAEYWWEQMRQPVRYGAGVELIASEGDWIWLEVGPGETLARLTGSELRRQGKSGSVISSLGREKERSAEQEKVLRALGEMWCHGVEIDWKNYFQDECRRRLSLPTYPFQRQSYIALPPQVEKEVSAANEIASTLEIQEIKQSVKEDVMSTDQTIPVTITRQQVLVERLCKAWGTMLGIDPRKIDPAATFFELGVDSLLLIQISKVIKDEFQVKIPFRKMLEEFTTIHGLCQHLDSILPKDKFQPEQPKVTVQEKKIDAVSVGQTFLPVTADTPKVFNGAAVSSSAIEQLVAQQLQIMASQLEVLKNGSGKVTIPAAPQQEATPKAEPLAESKDTATPDASEGIVVKHAPKQEPYVPYQPIRPKAGGALTAKQQERLKALIERHNARTQKSKQHIQKHRSHFADNRAMQGFRLQWKDLIYPIIGQSSEGSRMRDMDGNEYIDMTMGFGVHLFGHSPKFVVDAISHQLRHGLQLGPQSNLAGGVAEGISEMTGMERVTFCNSGTEAVMAALRLARVATGREKIVMFAGSFHGTFDGNLARIERSVNGEIKTVPAGPGTPRSMVQDVTALYYNQPESLDVIRKHAHELAAVLVEPVQSRRPDVQPRDFLQELRKITQESGTALIFDDMINGFRVHQAGTQGWFGVDADIVTYGKVIGGGMPLGIVTGKGQFIDGIDGGDWNFGDGSYPQADQAIFGGTFCKHPLTMASCGAVLAHLKQCGPQLQQQLNQKADRFAVEINSLLQKNRVPMQLANFGSLMRFLLIGNPVYMDLFFYYLLEKGVFIWEGRTSFISTAHSDADLAFVVHAFSEAIEEMRNDGLLEETDSAEEDRIPIPALAAASSASTQQPVYEVTKTPTPGLRPATEQQKQLWALAQLGEESSSAYNESMVITIHGDIDPEHMRQALQKVVERHESLRSVFTEDGEHQKVLAEIQTPFNVLDLSATADAEAKISHALRQEARTCFDLNHGPLIRGLLIKALTKTVLSIAAHHSVLDGWSGSTLLRDLNAYYLGAVRGEKVELPAPMQFGNYVEWQSSQSDYASAEDSRSWWLGEFAGGVPLLNLPTSFPRSPIYTHEGEHQRLSLGANLSDQLRAFSGQHGFTLFTVLLSTYTALLAHVSRQEQLVVGIHSAGQPLVDGSDLVGHCINLVPLRSEIDLDGNFLQHLAGCKHAVIGACEHQFYPYSKLAKDLNLRRDPSRLTLVEAVFNLDQSTRGLKLFGFDVEADTAPTGFTKWDLSWNLIDTGDDMFIKCEYNSGLYSTETIQQWLGEYESLLSVVAEQPHRKMSEVLNQASARAKQKRDREIKGAKAGYLERLKSVKRKSVVLTA